MNINVPVTVPLQMDLRFAIIPLPTFLGRPALIRLGNKILPALRLAIAGINPAFPMAARPTLVPV